jgi:hypothetical protein
MDFSYLLNSQQFKPIINPLLKSKQTRYVHDFTDIVKQEQLNRPKVSTTIQPQASIDEIVYKSPIKARR